MGLFSRKEKELIHQRCLDCVCSRCRSLKNGECEFKYNICIGKEEKTCKMKTCSEYKK